MFRVYNTEDGRRVQKWKDPTNDHAGYLIKIDIDSSGRYLATSCSNKCVYLWDMRTPEHIASLCGHAEVVTDLKFSHDGRRLYTIAGDRYHRFDCLDLFDFHLKILVVFLCGK
jgi:WD40 repeat protein